MEIFEVEDDTKSYSNNILIKAGNRQWAMGNGNNSFDTIYYICCD